MVRRPLKRLLNASEAMVHDRLMRVCEPHGAKVYPKVRLADVLSIEASGIEREEFSYALKAHLDFVIVDEKDDPLFAVEFDGPTHHEAEQIARDQMKDDLCRRFALPLLRVRDAHLEVYRTYDVLSWIVEQWFLQEAFDAAQAAGHIPFDEPFDPAAFVSLGDDRRFPMWLSLDAQLGLQRLHAQGFILRGTPSFFIGTDAAGAFRGLFWVLKSETEVIFSTTGARAQSFPVDVADLVAEIGVIKLYERAKQVLVGEAQAASVPEFERVLQQYEDLGMTMLLQASTGSSCDRST